MSLFNFKKNDDDKDKEIERLKEALRVESMRNLKDMTRLNKKWRVIIDKGQVELVVKQIDQIGEGK